MKKLIYLALLVTASTTYAQDKIECSSLQWDDATESIMQNGKPFTGVCENYYSDGNVKEIRSFENGKLNGPFKSYNQKGWLSEEGTYKKGVVDGIWKHYTPTGAVISEKTYKDGELVQ